MTRRFEGGRGVRPAAGAAPDARSSSQVQADLEQRGVNPEFSRSVAERLTPVVSELDADAYGAVLQAVTASYGVHDDDLRMLGQRTGDVDQIQRLMKGFVGELRKLEEAIRILSAYVTRMRSRAVRQRPRSFH